LPRAILREPFGGKGLLKIALISREISYIIVGYFYFCEFYNLSGYKKKGAP
jgi:hypothetical protein